MALNYVKGIISHLGNVESGTTQGGFSWARQIVVLDVASFNNTYQKIALTAQNDRVADLQQYQIGDRVEVGYSVSAREWQDRWFNNVDLINIKPASEAAAPAPAPRQAASIAKDAYEVCDRFCSEPNCDYRLGTHGEACRRAMAAGQFTPPAPATQPAARRVARPAGAAPAANEAQGEDLPF